MFIIHHTSTISKVFKTKQIELKIKGMSCNHCEMRVKKALESVPGVQSAKADYKKENVIIKTNDDVTKESLIKAVNETGLYEAEA
jgi:Cu2+-exporting ATPase